ncbi:MAG: hypothetical protein JWO70_1498 [Betaproteobacteria bacterium]|jgi:hypothetical protein|nr:hypothetical protein [Betaproteobacteria bacterium]
MTHRHPSSPRTRESIFNLAVAALLAAFTSTAFAAANDAVLSRVKKEQPAVLDKIGKITVKGIHFAA